MHETRTAYGVESISFRVRVVWILSPPRYYCSYRLRLTGTRRRDEDRAVPSKARMGADCDRFALLC